MHRTKRTIALIASAGAVSAVFASSASAHALHATCTTIDATEFPAGFNTATIDVLVNGAPAGLATYAWTVPPPAPPFPVPYAGPGPYQGDAVEVWGSFTSDYDQGRTLLFSSSACGPVRPAVVVVTPPVTPTPPVRLVGCADLPKGAGIKWRRKFGCVVPKVTPLTCAELIARHAGLRSLVARGCSTRPPELRRFSDVPVAG